MLPIVPTLLSFAAAVLCLFLPRHSPGLVRWIALATAAAGLSVSLACWCMYDPGQSGFQQVVAVPWVPDMAIWWRTGIDGVSVTMMVLTGLVAVAGVLISWDVEHRRSEFFAWYLVLIGGVYGVFISLDMVLFFIFYEIAIIPKYFLIAIWGGERRTYAAMKLALFSFASSTLVLFSILAMYYGSGSATLDITQLTRASNFSQGFQYAIFPVLFTGFGILAGMWPFHTWAPTGHVAAPPAASMLLAGVVMKLGAYGCLRMAIGTLPAGAQAWAPMFAILALAGILHGALAALAQRDFKYVIAYSSVSHMGFVLLGLCSLDRTGLTGSVLQMFSHGVLSPLLFALVAGIIYSRTHTRDLAVFDRFGERMPVIATFTVVAGLAAMGLPGFSGFVAELHILIGAWRQPAIANVVVVLAGVGIILTAAYTITRLHMAFFQKSVEPPPEVPWPQRFAPPHPREIAICVLLLGFSVWIGLYPSPMLRQIESGLNSIVAHYPTRWR